MPPAPKEDDLPIDWQWVKEDIIDGLVNTLSGEENKVGDIRLVDAANPVNWGRFAKTILGTLIAIVAVGLSAIQQAWLDVAAGYPTGLASFTDDLVTSILTLPGDLVGTAAQTTQEAAVTYGGLAYLVAVAAVLVGLYVVVRVVGVVR